MTEQIKEQVSAGAAEAGVGDVSPEHAAEQVAVHTDASNEASIALVESREAIAVTEPVEELPLDLKAPEL